MNILITGCAGFIGFHVADKLTSIKKNKVYGIDNLSKAHDFKLKQDRLKILRKKSNFFFKKIDIANDKVLNKLFTKYKFHCVIHLAAKAGVRDSIINPRDYLDSNIIGFFNILDISNTNKVNHFIYASTSSVYGNTKKFPSKEDDNTDKPVSFYGASKKANEVLAYSYSSIFKFPTTGLRFFTVYGPFGRPDMAPLKFTQLINKKKQIELYNNGKHVRDFTYIDDIVVSIIKLIDKPSRKKVPYNIFNIGSQNPKNLMSLVKNIESSLEKKSKRKYLPFQVGDVYKTYANNAKIINYIKYKPSISLKEGIKRLVQWYKVYK
tara:strand:+ start:467 stop:1429 length:963 start_codon:yes stop_codon:yes gene_type:complete